MIKSFVLTFVFWTLFTLTNSVGDAIDFYAVFPWYGNMDLWHFLKYFWIGFAVLTGVFAVKLWDEIWLTHVLYWRIDKLKEKPYKFKTAGVFTFLLLWFLFVRWILFEAFMWKWRN